MSTDLTLLAALQIGSTLLGAVAVIWLVGPRVRRVCDAIERWGEGIVRRRELKQLRAMQRGRQQMAQMFDPTRRM